MTRERVASAVPLTSGDRPPGDAVALSVTIEVTTWVTKLVGGDGSGSRLSEEAFAPGETVRDVLRRWSARFPELHAALWDRTGTALGEHIEVFVNDAVLGVSHELDSPLGGGERITLLGQFMGGAGDAHDDPLTASAGRSREGETTPRAQP